MIRESLDLRCQKSEERVRDFGVKQDSFLDRDKIRFFGSDTFTKEDISVRAVII